MCNCTHSILFLLYRYNKICIILLLGTLLIKTIDNTRIITLNKSSCTYSHQIPALSITINIDVNVLLIFLLLLFWWPSISSKLVYIIKFCYSLFVYLSLFLRIRYTLFFIKFFRCLGQFPVGFQLNIAILTRFIMNLSLSKYLILFLITYAYCSDIYVLSNDNVSTTTINPRYFIVRDSAITIILVSLIKRLICPVIIHYKRVYRKQ